MANFINKNTKHIATLLYELIVPCFKCHCVLVLLGCLQLSLLLFLLIFCSGNLLLRNKLCIIIFPSATLLSLLCKMPLYNYAVTLINETPLQLLHILFTVNVLLNVFQEFSKIIYNYIL